jgi:hypothetical protein
LQCIEFIRVHAHSTAKQTLKSSVPSVPIYIVKYSPIGPKDRRYSKYGSRYGKTHGENPVVSRPGGMDGHHLDICFGIFLVFSVVSYIGKNIGGDLVYYILVIVYLKGPTDYMGDRSTT